MSRKWLALSLAILLCGSSAAYAGKKLLLRIHIPETNIILEAEEIEEPPPVPPAEDETAPPPPSTGKPMVRLPLTKKGSVIYEGDKIFEDGWGGNVVGWAIFGSKPEAQAKFLDEMVANNMRLIRFLHWYGDYKNIGFEYKEEHLVAMDRFFAMCEERKIHVWFCPFHRQCIPVPEAERSRIGTTPLGDPIAKITVGTKKDAEGKDVPDVRDIKVWDSIRKGRGGAGEILPGEINGLFHWDDTLEELVRRNQEKLLTRVNTVTKRRWYEEISILEFANEHLAARAGLADLSNLSNNESRTLLSSQEGACQRKIRDYRVLIGQPTKNRFPMAECVAFKGWVGYSCFDRLMKDARRVGYTGLTNCTAFYGDAGNPSLIEMRRGDINVVHRYSSQIPVWNRLADGTPIRDAAGNVTTTLFLDPLSPDRNQATDWTIGSILAAMSFEGYPTAIGEISGVFEDKLRDPVTFGKSPSWATWAPHVAKIAKQQGCQLVAAYALHASPIPSGGWTTYDIMKDEAAKKAILEASVVWHATKPHTTVVEIKPPASDYVGVGEGHNWNAPLTGTQQWAKDVLGQNARTRIVWPEIPNTSTWLK